MIVVKGIEIDFDNTRTKDAERLESAKPQLTEVANILQNMGANVTFTNIAETTIKAVEVILGKEAVEKLGMSVENWVDCVETFAEMSKAIEQQGKDTNARLSKYSAMRLL